jgi:hypothetical protein
MQACLSKTGWHRLQGSRCSPLEVLQFESGMQTKPRSAANQLDLFQAQFDQLSKLSHPLWLVAAKIDWKQFDVAFADFYRPDTGAAGKDICLLVGLHDLEHTFGQSDESLLDRWVENP